MIVGGIMDVIATAGLILAAIGLLGTAYGLYQVNRQIIQASTQIDQAQAQIENAAFLENEILPRSLRPVVTSASSSKTQRAQR